MEPLVTGWSRAPPDPFMVAVGWAVGVPGGKSLAGRREALWIVDLSAKNLWTRKVEKRQKGATLQGSQQSQVAMGSTDNQGVQILRVKSSKLCHQRCRSGHSKSDQVFLVQPLPPGGSPRALHASHPHADFARRPGWSQASASLFNCLSDPGLSDSPPHPRGKP